MSIEVFAEATNWSTDNFVSSEDKRTIPTVPELDT